MKKLLLLGTLFLTGCLDYTWDKGYVWVTPDHGTYCVVYQPEGWHDMLPDRSDLRCGLSAEDAVTLRNVQAKLLHVDAK